MTSEKSTETHFILSSSGPARRKSHGTPVVGNARSRASGLTARCAFSLLVALTSILSAAMLFELAPLVQGKYPVLVQTRPNDAIFSSIVCASTSYVD